MPNVTDKPINISDSPFSESYSEDQDNADVIAAQNGDKEAVKSLCLSHYPWIYHVSLKMLSHPADAEDAAQEIVVKAMTGLHGFSGKSSFRTWIYRIAVNHLLDRKRSIPETLIHDFRCYGSYIDRASSDEFSAAELETPETMILIAEAKVSCLLGMLLCLNRQERMAFLLGELLETGANLGGDLMSISPENFRQLLHRARDGINAFTAEKCGLINPSRPCRCEKRTKAFIKDGIIQPKSLLFMKDQHARVRESLSDALHPFEQSYGQVAKDIFNGQPFWNSPDYEFLTRLLRL
jgi:RNA polymerase sigma factor (sigma-70 family)